MIGSGQDFFEGSSHSTAQSPHTTAFSQLGVALAPLGLVNICPRAMPGLHLNPPSRPPGAESPLA